MIFQREQNDSKRAKPIDADKSSTTTEQQSSNWSPWAPPTAQHNFTLSS